MLFDLQGKRRRVVQFTYLMLAVLMGGGLALFGVGSDIQGGIFDAFKGGGGNSNGNSLVAKRVEKNEKKLKVNPRSEALRKSLTRDYYQLASVQVGQNDTRFPGKAKDELNKAASNWEAYIALSPKKPDTSLARVALQIYDPSALNRPARAVTAARLIAQQQDDAQSYVSVAQYAALAKDKRTVDLAGQKALDLAKPSERKQVKAALEQAKKPPAPAGGQKKAPPSLVQ